MNLRKSRKSAKGRESTPDDVISAKGTQSERSSQMVEKPSESIPRVTVEPFADGYVAPDFAKVSPIVAKANIRETLLYRLLALYEQVGIKSVDVKYKESFMRVKSRGRIL